MSDPVGTVLGAAMALLLACAGCTRSSQPTTARPSRPPVGSVAVSCYQPMCPDCGTIILRFDQGRARPATSISDDHSGPDEGGTKTEYSTVTVRNPGAWPVARYSATDDLATLTVDITGAATPVRQFEKFTGTVTQHGRVARLACYDFVP